MIGVKRLVLIYPLVSRFASAEADFVGRLVLKRRADPLRMTKGHVMPNSRAQLRQTDIFLDLDV